MNDLIPIRRSFVAAHVCMSGVVIASMFMGLFVPALIWIASSIVIGAFGRELP